MHPLPCNVKGARNQVQCLPALEILQIFKMFEGKLEIFSRFGEKSYRCSKVFLKTIGENAEVLQTFKIVFKEILEVSGVLLKNIGDNQKNHFQRF